MTEFMYLFRATDESRQGAMGSPAAAQRSIETWLKWLAELDARGHLASRGLPIGPTGGVVRGKEKVVTDGPYVEAKDLVLGFIVVKAKDLAEALELAKGCPMLAGDGSVEVRPVAQL